MTFPRELPLPTGRVLWEQKPSTAQDLEMDIGRARGSVEIIQSMRTLVTSSPILPIVLMSPCVTSPAAVTRDLLCLHSPVFPEEAPRCCCGSQWSCLPLWEGHGTEPVLNWNQSLGFRMGLIRRLIFKMFTNIMDSFLAKRGNSPVVPDGICRLGLLGRE